MRKSCPLLLSRAHNVHCICLFDFGHGSRFGSTCQLFFRIGFGTKPVNQPSFVAVFWRVLIIIIWLFCARHGRFHWTQHRRTSEQCAAYPRLLIPAALWKKYSHNLPTSGTGPIWLFLSRICFLEVFCNCLENALRSSDTRFWSCALGGRHAKDR